MQFAKVES